jgi:MoaA/NifB/PqqE/SkfB family radical SAM enzyme
VLSAEHLRSNLLVKLGERTGLTHTLPLVLFAPTSRCNSRCVSCDWWRSDGADDLTLGEIEQLADGLRYYGTRTIVFTGGEPLVRTDVMEVADVFRARGFTLQLLTSGLALERFAPEIAARFSEVTVSLDGDTPELYRTIRGVNGLPALSAGVRRLRGLAPELPIRARTTVHRHNLRAMVRIISKSLDIGCTQISFLAADVTSDSFNRTSSLPQVVEPSPASRLTLDASEATEMEGVVEDVIRARSVDLAERRIVPGPAGLRRLVAYYRAHLGMGPFPAVDCSAPWTSLVIEANGGVRPCFFHPVVGSLRRQPLDELLTVAMPQFRRTLTVANDPTCQRCVCTLKVGLSSKLW